MKSNFFSNLSHSKRNHPISPILKKIALPRYHLPANSKQCFLSKLYILNKTFSSSNLLPKILTQLSILRLRGKNLFICFTNSKPRKLFFIVFHQKSISFLH